MMIMPANVVSINFLIEPANDDHHLFCPAMRIRNNPLHLHQNTTHQVSFFFSKLRKHYPTNNQLAKQKER
jgi:23S rRNA A2030 N6-methylase RlmJ